MPNKYHEFILGELLHFHDRYINTDQRIKPGLYFGKVQSAFLRETFNEMEVDKLLIVEYGICNQCKGRCGHMVVHLTPKGIEMARKLDKMP